MLGMVPYDRPVAGPSAVVLLPDAWTARDAEEFRAWLAESFDPDSGNDWWVLRDPRPLGMSEPLQTGPMLVEATPYEEDDAEEMACLTRAAGFTPRSEIVLAAAVNGQDDHRLLAVLAVAIARRYRGMISLDGLLPAPSPPSVVAAAAGNSSTRHQTRAEQSATIMTLRGQWNAIPYRTAAGEVATYHVVNADLLISWLEHPQFRMVK